MTFFPVTFCPFTVLIHVILFTICIRLNEYEKEALIIAVSILHYIITVITELEFYPWYFDPPTHGISIPLPIVFQPPSHGILTLYPWYFNPLAMVF